MKRYRVFCIALLLAVSLAYAEIPPPLDHDCRDHEGTVVRVTKAGVKDALAARTLMNYRKVQLDTYDPTEISKAFARFDVHAVEFPFPTARGVDDARCFDARSCQEAVEEALRPEAKACNSARACEEALDASCREVGSRRWPVGVVWLQQNGTCANGTFMGHCEGSCDNNVQVEIVCGC